MQDQTQAVELSPWLIVHGQTADASLALWRIGEKDALALAMFSDRSGAIAYAEQSGLEPFDTLRMGSKSLVRVFIDCYQQGIEYAVLDPSQSATRQVFVVQQVLRAARASLSTER